MPEIRTHQQLWGMPFPTGAEWDAGYSPPGSPPDHNGRWTMRREPERFAVYFQRFSDDQETLLAEFPSSEAGEIEAKTFALAACQNRQFQPVPKE